MILFFFWTSLFYLSTAFVLVNVASSKGLTNLYWPLSVFLFFCLGRLFLFSFVYTFHFFFCLSSLLPPSLFFFSTFSPFPFPSLSSLSWSFFDFFSFPFFKYIHTFSQLEKSTVKRPVPDKGPRLRSTSNGSQVSPSLHVHGLGRWCTRSCYCYNYVAVQVKKKKREREKERVYDEIGRWDWVVDWIGNVWAN